MSLPVMRANLVRALDATDAGARLAHDWPAMRSLIFDWFVALKETERDDTIGGCFNDQRLILRYIKTGASETRVINAFHGKGGKEMTPLPRPTIIDPSLVGVKKLLAEAEARSNPRSFKIGMGARELMARMDPDNFIKAPNGDCQKIEMGLYDLSASLLDPRRPISAQTFNAIKDGDIYAFMPVALPEDQILFQRLNALGKEHRKILPALYETVRELRRGLTRIKLACEHDMGTNFTAFAPTNMVNPKFRYGQSRLTKVPDPDKPGELKESQNTAAIINQRKRDAVNYRAILTAAYTVNEITVAFREHRGSFPLFGIWEAQRGLFIENRIVDGALQPTGRTIADQPARP